MSKPDTITAYKAFGPDWKCRDFQYQVGGEYTTDAEPKACESGFHACENPLDVLSYYDLTASKFAEVELSGKIDRHADDSKIASASIKIKAELSLSAFIGAAVGWLIKDTAWKAKNVDDAQLASSGNYAKLASSGDSAKLASSGYSAQLASSGYSAQLASSGDSAKLASSGDSAQLASSGDYAKLASSGYYAKLASSGDSAQLASSGKDGVIASAGIGATAKGADGTWISLAEFDANYKCIGFATGCIGKDGLKADTPYSAKDGKLVPA